METLEKVIDVNHLTKEELIERYEWQLNNLINPETYLFETTTDIASRFRKHPVEWNRMLRDAGILEPVYRVGKRGNYTMEVIGWRVQDEHRKYLLANALVMEARETRDAVYWNQSKITHIVCYINTYLKKAGLPLLTK